MGKYWVHSAPEGIDFDERECARGARCANPRVEVVDGETIRMGALTPRGLCDSCASLVERSLQELPALWARLHEEIGTKPHLEGPRVFVGKAEPPVPLNLSVDELLRETVHVLASWHERVAAVARLAGEPGRRITHETVEASCAVLAAHVGVLLALPEEPMLRWVTLRDAAALPEGTTGMVHVGAEYADVLLPLDGAQGGIEILDLHYRHRRMLGETDRAARRLNGVCCGNCGFAELREALDGDGQFAGAKCRECGQEYDADEYRALTVEQGKTLKAAGVRAGSPVHAGPFDDTTSRRA